jgi:hypothetical protein
MSNKTTKLNCLKETIFFREPCIRLDEIQHPLYIISYKEKKLEIWNLDTMEMTDKFVLKLKTKYNKFYCVNIQRKDRILISSEFGFTIYDLESKKFIYQKSVPIFLKLKHIPNKSKVGNFMDGEMQIIDYEMDYKSPIDTIRIPFDVKSFEFFNENKFICTNWNSIFIYENGNQIFQYSNEISSFFTLLNEFQLFDIDFVLNTANGFFYFHENRIQFIPYFDTFLLKLLFGQYFFKLNTRNKIEIFKLYQDPNTSKLKIKMMKSAVIQDDIFIQNVLMCSNGDLISWSDKNLKVWETHLFVEIVEIENHFIHNSFQKESIQNLFFNFD